MAVILHGRTGPERRAGTEIIMFYALDVDSVHVLNIVPCRYMYRPDSF